MFNHFLLKLAAVAGLFAAAAAPAQVDADDPRQAAPIEAAAEAQPVPEYQPVDPGSQESTRQAEPAEPYYSGQAAPETPATPQTKLAPVQDTVDREDLFSAAEGVFGKGAEGLAGLIEKILKDQGEPVAYIAGREAGGAFVAGVRYGSGTMRHQVEGDKAVFWTGPTLGFDFGADANKVFVLVYNLHDSQELFKRYPAAEGHAYALGGFTASYLRRGDVVLIPVRLGVGLRLGANVGYMRFSEKNRWLPF
ncbi:MAG TPA: DUF1134 domain-containing protein [Allosphingosinicella sp.]|jgi:hypothetical protein|uniref:DUF1134 domain-containing protein n=1 Tax=Allosphingosinicella sp. TaxID=2823234 RepID=UPI002F2A0BE7